MLAVLRHTQFARFALCRFLTTLSWQMFGVAVGWQVYALTHSALALGLIGLSEFLPFLCLVLWGGHVADHCERRNVLLIAWGIDALCIAAVLVVTIVGGQLVWPIYAAIGIFGATRAFWAPALQALAPSLLPIEEFPRALALNSTLYQAAVIAGPALGGVLFLLGPAAVFGACLLLFVTAVSVAFSIRPRARVSSEASMPQGHWLLEGLRYVLHQRLMFGLISLDLAAVLFGGAIRRSDRVAAHLRQRCAADRAGRPGLAAQRTGGRRGIDGRAY